MSTDIDRKTLVPLRLAVQFVPLSSRTGRRLHYSALYRWVSRGLLAANGTRVFLKAKKAGSSVCTTRAAIEAFLAATAAGSVVPGDRAKQSLGCTVSAQARRRRVEVARALDEAGF